jgi:hypothetical protein
MGIMAERGVGGTVKLDYLRSGVIWRLTCPAENALERWEREQADVERRQPDARLALTR